jgi:hypothetical protein
VVDRRIDGVEKRTNALWRRYQRTSNNENLRQGRREKYFDEDASMKAKCKKQS